MKILHISQPKISKKNSISGIKTVLLEEIKWENSNLKIESKIYALNKIEENEELYINNFSYKIDILRYLPDFVIFDGFYIFSHLKIAKFLKKNGIKYYIKPHGGFDKNFQRQNLYQWLKKITARIIFFSNFVEKSNGIIYLNNEEKNNSIYKKNNFFILPNGIKARDIVSAIKEKKQQEINFIYLGRIDLENKGIKELLEVLKKNFTFFKENKIIFNFYGDGKLKDVNFLKKEIKLISDIAKYFGVIYGEKKFKVLAEQDIYILNSRNEGMPMSIIESLITGIPCFISKESNMEEYIKKYDCGWIYRREKISLFEALKECIQNYRKNKKKYMENSKKCGQSFYWNNLEKIYQEAYLKMR